MESAEETLGSLQAEEARLSTAIHLQGRDKGAADAVLADQKEKISRAEARLTRLREDLVRLRGDDDAQVMDADLRLADVREMNRAVLRELKTMAAKIPAAGIVEQLELAGLSLTVAGRG